MMRTIRRRSGIVLVGGILATMFMLLDVLNNKSVAQGMVQDIAAGDQHCLALMSDGTVWAWGANWYGEVGDDTHRNNRFPPAQVKGEGGVGFLSGVQAIAAGSQHSLALTLDGTMYAWGLNDDCQGAVFDTFCSLSSIFDHSIEDRPDQVEWLDTQMQAIAGGGVHTLALAEDGTVWAWGGNGYCQLGVTGDPIGPVQVKGPNGVGFLSDVTAIAAGYHHSLAIKSDGTVWAWGGNEHGQLGIGTSIGSSCYPVQVKGLDGVGVLSDVKAVDAGTFFSLALKNDGSVWAWGGNDYGQLGTNSTHEHQTPTQVQGPDGVDVSGYLSGIANVAAGEHHSLALAEDGTVWAWGGNNNGQLGTNSTLEHHTPTQVQGPGGVAASGYLSDVKAVDAGEFFSLALKNDGSVWAWGGNSYGQIDATLKDHTTPVQVGGLTHTNTIPAPEEAMVMSYEASETPVLDSDPQQAMPIGIGPFASGGDTFRLHLNLNAFAGPVDLYFGIFAPEVDPLNMCILKSDLTFQTRKDEITPWKTNVISSISESLFGEIPVYIFPPSKYYIYLAATQAGKDFSSGYYLWSAQFEIGTEEEPWWWAIFGQLETANIESVCDLFSSNSIQWPR